MVLYQSPLIRKISKLQSKLLPEVFSLIHCFVLFILSDINQVQLKLSGLNNSDKSLSVVLLNILVFNLQFYFTDLKPRVEESVLGDCTEVLIK